MGSRVPKNQPLLQVKRIPGTACWKCSKCGVKFYVGACGGGAPFRWCPSCQPKGGTNA